jgi:hypothetical protein
VALLFVWRVVAGRVQRLVDNVKLEAGDCVVFPAKKVWHRVTKVQSGLRRTVVSKPACRTACDMCRRQKTPHPLQNKDAPRDWFWAGILGELGWWPRLHRGGGGGGGGGGRCGYDGSRDGSQHERSIELR